MSGICYTPGVPHSSAVLDRDLGADGCRATGLCSCYRVAPLGIIIYLVEIFAYRISSIGLSVNIFTT